MLGVGLAVADVVMAVAVVTAQVGVTALGMIG